MEKQGLIERIKNNLVITIIIISVAVAGATWTAATKLLVDPRNYTIDQLKEKNKALEEKLNKYQSIDEGKELIVLSPTPISKDKRISVNNGQIYLVCDGVYPNSKFADFKIIVPGQKDQDLNHVDTTAIFDYKGQKYVLNVLDFSSDTVQISIAKVK